MTSSILDIPVCFNGIATIRRGTNGREHLVAKTFRSVTSGRTDGVPHSLPSI